jgi:hypothetical protein
MVTVGQAARMQRSLPPESTKGFHLSLNSMTGERLTTNGSIRPREAAKNVGIIAGTKIFKIFLI